MLWCAHHHWQVICHGIPDQRELQGGDIVNVDVTAFIGGYHGDLNETFCVGEVREGGNALRDRKGGGCTQCWLGGQQVQHKVSPCTFSQVVQDNLAVMLLPPPPLSCVTG